MSLQKILIFNKIGNQILLKNVFYNGKIICPMKNYYTILEITDLASQEDVKKSYRRLVCKYHPDKTHADAAYDDQIRDINEAYATLGDPEKRKDYDNEMKKENEAEHINVSREPAFEEEIPDIFSAFDEFFFNNGMFGSPFGTRYSQSNHGKTRVTDIASGRDFYI